MGFSWTFQFAEQILQSDWSYFPEPLKGYEHFRSPTIDGVGRFHRDPPGARSRIFFRGGNVWRDEHPQDDEFWRRWEEQLYPDKTEKEEETCRVVLPKRRFRPRMCIE